MIDVTPAVMILAFVVAPLIYAAAVKRKRRKRWR